jgi:hypothetical protein
VLDDFVHSQADSLPATQGSAEFKKSQGPTGLTLTLKQHLERFVCSRTVKFA